MDRHAFARRRLPSPGGARLTSLTAGGLAVQCPGSGLSRDSVDTLCLSPSILKVRITAPPWQRGSQESRVCDESCEGSGLLPFLSHPTRHSHWQTPLRPLQRLSPSRQPLCYHWSPCHRSCSDGARASYLVSLHLSSPFHLLLSQWPGGLSKNK